MTIIQKTLDQFSNSFRRTACVLVPSEGRGRVAHGLTIEGRTSGGSSEMVRSTPPSVLSKAVDGAGLDNAYLDTLRPYFQPRCRAHRREGRFRARQRTAERRVIWPSLRRGDDASLAFAYEGQEGLDHRNLPEQMDLEDFAKFVGGRD
jgi:hypothetical protein